MCPQGARVFTNAIHAFRAGHEIDSRVTINIAPDTRENEKSGKT